MKRGSVESTTTEERARARYCGTSAEHKRIRPTESLPFGWEARGTQSRSYERTAQCPSAAQFAAVDTPMLCVGPMTVATELRAEAPLSNACGARPVAFVPAAGLCAAWQQQLAHQRYPLEPLWRRQELEPRGFASCNGLMDTRE